MYDKEKYRESFENLYDGLNFQQELAAKKFVEFRKARYPKKIFRLEGVAGSGKSFLTSRFVQFLLDQGKSVLVTAPTHQAAGVIRSMLVERGIHVEVQTIHKALNLVVKSETDDRGKIHTSLIQTRPIDAQWDFLLCDEASMLGKDICFHLERSIQKAVKSKLILVGDYYQLPPVNEPESVCRSWDAECAQLTEVMRNSGELLRFASVCRKWITKHDGRFELPLPKAPVEADGISFVTQEQFEEKLLLFRQLHGPENARLIGFTNKIVDYYSDWLRQKENPDLSPLMPYAPNQMVMTSVGGISKAASINDPGDYDEQLLRPTTELKFLGYEESQFKHPHLTDMGDVFNVGRFQEDENTIHRLFVLPWQGEIRRALAKRMADMRVIAESKKDPAVWASYYNVKCGFALLADAGAMTVHRSQGSQFEHCFVTSDAFLSTGSMWKDPRLSYVASTRSQKSLTVCIEPMSIPEPKEEEQGTLQLLFS